jgi:tripartite-type tricarboxylate transporter receptor subunit TctC
MDCPIEPPTVSQEKRRREDQLAHHIYTCCGLLRWPAWHARLAALVLALVASPAALSPAAAYPDRPIRMIIPLPAGGAVDIVARLMQPHLEKALGQPIVIDNRAGASGIVGAQTVANAEPDGHTLLLVPTTFTINPAIHPKLPFDPIRAFEPVSIIGRNSLLFLVNADVKANSLQEFVALVKSQPGKLNYSTPGASSQAHLLLELWSSQAGIHMQHIPYRGGAPAVMAAVTGEVQLTLISPTASLPQIEAKKLRPLATGGATREEQLPNVPTAAEAGFPEFKGLQWIGLLATGGTPKPIVDRLNGEIEKMLQMKDFQAKLQEQGMTIAGGPPSDFRALIESEIKQWTEVARKANIKVQ